MFILWLQLPWTTSCSGHFTSFVPAAARGPGACWCVLAQMQRSVVFTIWQFHVKKEILPPSTIITPYCRRTFGSLIIQGASFTRRKVITKDKPFNELPRPTVLFCIPLFSDLVFDSVLFWRAKNGPRVFWGMMWDWTLRYISFSYKQEVKTNWGSSLFANAENFRRA